LFRKYEPFEIDDVNVSRVSLSIWSTPVDIAWTHPSIYR